MHNEWVGVLDSYPYVHGILLSYAKFSVFDAEYGNTQCGGRFGLFHAVHITVERLDFGFGEV